MCENCAIMVKKYDPNHKYGNPTPIQLPRSDKGRFLPLKSDLTKKHIYSNKKRRAVSISLTAPQHQLLEKVASSIGVSMRGFVCSATLMHLNKIAQELAQQTGKVIE